MKDGQCIRRLQQTHAGRRPMRMRAVMKDDGALTKGPTEVVEQWHQHFHRILNIVSEFREDVIEGMATLQPLPDLDRPPSEEELDAALSKLKTRKAGGKSGILPELILHGGATLWEHLLLLMQEIWKEGTVVASWRDALVVLIPKKGNVQICDNWQGISLGCGG